MGLVTSMLVAGVLSRLPREVLIPVLGTLGSILAATIVYWLFIRVPPSKRLPARRILVTGAARGVGRAIALGAARRGASIVMWDIDARALAGAAAEARALAAPGASVDSIVLNVGDAAAVASAFAIAVKDGGVPDSIVAAAGVVTGLRATELTGEDVTRTLAVNVGSVFSLARAALPRYAALPSTSTPSTPAARGTLVILSSTMGWLGASRLSDYCASKWALNGLADSLRQEVNSEPRTRGRVGVHLVCPHTIGDTDLFKGAFSSDAHKKALVSRLISLVLRPLKTEAVADAILDDLAFSHGTHKVTFLPFVARIFVLVPRIALTFALAVFDSLVAASGGAHGMDGWVGAGRGGVEGAGAGGSASAAKARRSSSTSRSSPRI